MAIPPEIASYPGGHVDGVFLREPLLLEHAIGFSFLS
jgi:hypothetical protein